MLPAPFHMTGSFASFAPIGLKDKMSIAWAMLNILQTNGRTWDVDQHGGISMLDWLRRRGQTKGAIERFWRVVLVSALDEELDKTDARYGIDVFWKAFLSNRTGYRMGVPVVPLAQLYEGCKTAIENRGGEVQLRAPARNVRVENNSVAAVSFDGGREETADAYVIAVPHTALPELLAEDVKCKDSAFRNLAMLKSAPITGVHLWFDREVLDEPFVTLLDTTTQWIFNKSRLYGTSNGSSEGKNSTNGQYLQLVVSASYDLLQKPRQEIIDLCLKEVRQALPAARDANLLKATVIKEAAATFSPEPGVDRWRPKQETTVNGLFLAGDWTDTGWPATMEGAVRSGYLAAEAILRREGRPHRLVQPDLSPDGLVGLWARG
jgi:zeta-carotene desaturase